MERVMIIGATSAIAMACARIWAQEGAELCLVGRDEAKLQQIGSDLAVRGAGAVHTQVLDLLAMDDYPHLMDNCFRAMPEFDIVLLAHGTLPDQKRCEADVAYALQEFSINGLSHIAMLTLLAGHMQSQGYGTLAVITSVAGDRGRPSNYLYGTAKAAVSTFCEGLRARLFKHGVHVLTIKPGFVDTPMTQGLELPNLLVSSPDAVAKLILRGISSGKNVIYTPGYWRIIMTIIRMIPVVVFKHLHL